MNTTKKIPPSSILADLSTEELRTEIIRREREASELRWQTMIKNAKYLCPDCGGPDSWHTRDCSSDTDIT